MPRTQTFNQQQNDLVNSVDMDIHAIIQEWPDFVEKCGLPEEDSNIIYRIRQMQKLRIALRAIRDIFHESR